MLDETSVHHLLHGLLWYHADHLAGDCVVAILLYAGIDISVVGVAILGGILVLVMLAHGILASVVGEEQFITTWE